MTTSAVMAAPVSPRANALRYMMAQPRPVLRAHSARRAVLTRRPNGPAD